MSSWGAWMVTPAVVLSNTCSYRPAYLRGPWRGRRSWGEIKPRVLAGQLGRGRVSPPARNAQPTAHNAQPGTHLETSVDVPPISNPISWREVGLAPPQRVVTAYPTYPPAFDGGRGKVRAEIERRWFGSINQESNRRWQWQWHEGAQRGELVLRGQYEGSTHRPHLQGLIGWPCAPKSRPRWSARRPTVWIASV